jgi:hypothetical protein
MPGPRPVRNESAKTSLRCLQVAVAAPGDDPALTRFGDYRRIVVYTEDQAPVAIATASIYMMCIGAMAYGRCALLQRKAGRLGAQETVPLDGRRRRTTLRSGVNGHRVKRVSRFSTGSSLNFTRPARPGLPAR